MLAIKDRVYSEIDQLLKEMPWPEISSIFDKQSSSSDWKLVQAANRLFDGNDANVLPAVSAILCLQKSIILVDDILDDDPEGKHIAMGSGRAANLALALQAASIKLIERCDVSVERRRVALLALNQMALDTAIGQELDVQNLTGEENYWRVIRAKSTPFYGTALILGALLAGSSQDKAQTVYNIGVLFGENIQIYDDLEDAFQVPANPDWLQGRNNLLLLYGSTANHDERDRFVELRANAQDPVSLQAAQEILVRSGAVAYCFYQIIERERQARQMLDQLDVPEPQHIWQIFVEQRQLLEELAAQTGVEIGE